MKLFKIILYVNLKHIAYYGHLVKENYPTESTTVFYCHLTVFMDWTFYYVNKEYNQGILKGIKHFLIRLQTFQFTIFNPNGLRKYRTHMLLQDSLLLL